MKKGGGEKKTWVGPFPLLVWPLDLNRPFQAFQDFWRYESETAVFCLRQEREKSKSNEKICQLAHKGHISMSKCEAHFLRKKKNHFLLKPTPVSCAIAKKCPPPLLLSHNILQSLFESPLVQYLIFFWLSQESEEIKTGSSSLEQSSRSIFPVFCFSRESNISRESFLKTLGGSNRCPNIDWGFNAGTALVILVGRRNKKSFHVYETY